LLQKKEEDESKLAYYHQSKNLEQIFYLNFS